VNPHTHTHTCAAFIMIAARLGTVVNYGAAEAKAVTYHIARVTTTQQLVWSRLGSRFQTRCGEFSSRKKIFFYFSTFTSSFMFGSGPSFATASGFGAASSSLTSDTGFGTADGFDSVSKLPAAARGPFGAGEASSFGATN
jgi:hypothetical protein